MNSRRSFLAGSAASVVTAASLRAAAPSSLTDTVSLDGAWRFRLDREEAWREVTVPHTWQVEPGCTEYYGPAVYERSFFAPGRWAACAVRIRFEAVYHSARVEINGKLVGEHLRKGYTPFTLDITPHVRVGAVNTIRVRVDNSFDGAMLPRGRSSDWAHDGGLFRPVSMLITPHVFIERIEIDAPGAVSVRAVIRNSGSSPASGSLLCGVEDVEVSARYNIARGAASVVSLPPIRLSNPKLWHFDDPHLYEAKVRLDNGHEYSDTFGIRTIETRDNGFYLNGERVRLMGVERMAGSNPEFGMAEPSHWIDHDHADMQELNCVYTRVHWPQDRRVLDYCDRNGILIQTEVPAWGPKTFEGMKGEPSAEIMENGLGQLREMVAEARNHPCIFSWGLCNEINGQNPPAAAFVRRMYQEAKKLDPTRLATYASHSLFKTPEKDVAGELDYVMFNEYYGSWQKGGPEDLQRTLDAIHRAFPNKALVISEYGYCACTAERPEDDGKRTQVLFDHDRVFRDRPWVAGLIFFCYNDYRTHIGDKGIGAAKQRVHGVVDLYGARKPSFEALRRESSPIAAVSMNGSSVVTIASRETVPSWTLRRYRLRAVVYGHGDIPLERFETPLPDIRPGSQVTATLKLTTENPGRIRLDVLRPGGISVFTTVTG